jgi:hypothetical protein
MELVFGILFFVFFYANSNGSLCSLATTKVEEKDYGARFWHPFLRLFLCQQQRQFMLISDY